ncbi:hypothetical protein TNCV_4471501 [Trichonephila clavipes]|uniref:Uncharacterized protein n=1 Tax=Trichonephila clavipes TaxID=2585209 RepID=A0A8X6VFV9_TRICX|nr:hypothetical protein TNCV_4471501 [Trichonephila clavipes]
MTVPVVQPVNGLFNTRFTVDIRHYLSRCLPPGCMSCLGNRARALGVEDWKQVTCSDVSLDFGYLYLLRAENMTSGL